MKLAVVGAKGRMGQAIVRLAPEHGWTVAAALDKGDDLATIAGVDAVVDFSHASSAADVAAAAARAKAALVSGTTGLDARAEAALDAAAKVVPVLWEPNMSVGVLVLGQLLREALALLGADADVEIVETHHRMKADAPSGTALRLVEIARRAREGAPVVTGREGKPGPRGREIGVLAVRGGDVVGDHTVHLLGQGERLELTHRATSRDVFAHGALRAASWLAGKPARRYRLADVVGA